MANQSRCRPARCTATRPPATEPPVRRWVHPIEGGICAQQTDPALYYIRCALSYQNQMLGDIKTLLQQLVEQSEENQKP